MGKKKRKAFTVDEDIAEQLGEVGNASKIVNDLLNEWFKGGRDGPIALEVKLQEVERRLNEAMDERDSINRRIERLRNQKGRIEKEIHKRKEEREDRLREAAPILRGKDVDNPAVENWANKLGMSPHDLLEAIEELDSESRDSTETEAYA